MRSVVVVLPASMCAMMPMLRQRSSGKVRATAEQPRSKRALARLPGLGERLPGKERTSSADAGFLTARDAASSLERAALRPLQQALRKLVRPLDEAGIAQRGRPSGAASPRTQRRY